MGSCRDRRAEGAGAGARTPSRRQASLVSFFRTPPRAGAGGGRGGGGAAAREVEAGPHVGERRECAGSGRGGWAEGGMEDAQARLLEGYLEAYRDAGPRARRRGDRRRKQWEVESGGRSESTARLRSSRARGGGGEPPLLWEGGGERAERDGQRFLEIISRLVQAGTHPGRAIPAQAARIAVQAWAHSSPHLAGMAVQTMELCRRLAPPVGPVEAGPATPEADGRKRGEEAGEEKAKIWLDPAAWCPAEGWSEAEALRALRRQSLSQSTPGQSSQPATELDEVDAEGGERGDEEERADELAATGRELSQKERRMVVKDPILRQWMWLTGLCRSALAAAERAEGAETRPVAAATATGPTGSEGAVLLLRSTIRALQEDLGLRAASFRRYGDSKILEHSLLHRLLAATEGEHFGSVEEARKIDGILTRRQLCRLLVELAWSPGVPEDEEPMSGSQRLQKRLDALVEGAPSGGPSPEPSTVSREELGALGGALLEMILNVYSALEDSGAYLALNARNQRNCMDFWMIDALRFNDTELTSERNEFLRALSSPAHKMRLLTQLTVTRLRGMHKKHVPREEFKRLWTAVDALGPNGDLRAGIEYFAVPFGEVLGFIATNVRFAVQSVFLCSDSVALVVCHGALCWLRDHSLDPGLNLLTLRGRLCAIAEVLRGGTTPGKRKRTYQLSDEAHALLAVAEAFMHHEA